MISATELRPGMVVVHNGELHRAHSVVHKTPGNLRGFVQAKLRNLKSGAMNEHRFRSEDRIEKAEDALFGSLVIATIANGLNTLNLTQGVIFITTGGILLFAVTLDTVLRRRQRAAGR